MSDTPEITQPTVNVGAIVYSYNGECARVEAVTPRFIIVSEDYEDPNTGDTYQGPLVKWYTWALSPTTARRKKEDRLAGVMEQIAKAKKQLKEIRNQVDNSGYELKELQKAVEKYAPLKEAMHYCATGVTYVVSTDVGNIEPYDYADRYSDKQFRMLSLRPSPKVYGKHVEWQLNSYRDGSGYDRNVLLCATLEEAQDKAKVIIEGNLTKAIDRLQEQIENATEHSSVGDWITTTIKNAQRLAIPVPEDLPALIKKLGGIVHLKKIAALQARLDELMAKDAALAASMADNEAPGIPPQEGGTSKD